LDKELIQNISEEELYEKMKHQSIPFVVIFYASWCPKSKQLLEIVPEIIQKYQEKVKFLKIEVEGKKKGEITSRKIHDFCKIKDYPVISLFYLGIFLGMVLSQKDRDGQIGDLERIIQNASVYFPR